MAVTIHVNGTSNSLVHKGSMGIAKNTLPDVCKTPSPGGPVPIPYPIIISMSSDLVKGTKTVKVDGGNMAAIKGSQFSRCTGDEPGTAGGVKSSTNMKEATWITSSPDVKMEGKNVCRLSDKMQMNHGNTVCLAGETQVPVSAAPPKPLQDICCECDKKVKPKPGQKCMSLGEEKHKCCEEKIKKHKGTSKLGGERGYTKNGTPISGPRGPGNIPKGSVWPDACTLDSDGNPDQFFDFKFSCPEGTPVREHTYKRPNKARGIVKGARATLLAGPPKPGKWGRGQKKKVKNLGKKLTPKVTKKPMLVKSSDCP